MDFEQHFNEDTPYITLDGFTPMANSKPIDNIFLNKKVKKVLKGSGYTSSQHMNVVYEQKKSIKVGSIVRWELRGMSFDVVVLGYGDLFVKGLRVHAYCVGIIE